MFSNVSTVFLDEMSAYALVCRGRFHLKDSLKNVNNIWKHPLCFFLFQNRRRKRPNIATDTLGDFVTKAEENEGNYEVEKDGDLVREGTPFYEIKLKKHAYKVQKFF